MNLVSAGSGWQDDVNSRLANLIAKIRCATIGGALGIASGPTDDGLAAKKAHDFRHSLKSCCCVWEKNGGGAGIRTRVRKYILAGIYDAYPPL
jgi:hypothetical protein